MPTTNEATYGAARRSGQPGSRGGGHSGEDLLPGPRQVVNDVVGLAGTAVLKGGHRGRGGVLVVDPAEHSALGHRQAPPGRHGSHAGGVVEQVAVVGA